MQIKNTELTNFCSPTYRSAFNEFFAKFRLLKMRQSNAIVCAKAIKQTGQNKQINARQMVLK